MKNLNFLEALKSLTPREKISKAKLSLYRFSPFFGYIVENLKFASDDKGQLPYPTMGVDAKGNVIYSEEFVIKTHDANPDYIVGTIAHEGCHAAFLHIARQGGRRLMVNGTSLWNIAIDIITNQLLLQNGFLLPPDSLIPKDNSIVVFEKTIEKISEKSAEEIYDELKSELKQMAKDGKAQMQECPGGSGEEFDVPKGAPKGVDYHFDTPIDGSGSGNGDEKSDGSGQGKEGKDTEQQAREKDWSEIVTEAYNHAKQIGKAPAGMERMFEHLNRHKLNWRTILRRTVASKIPFDTTYTKPNKKYLCHDIIMPGFYGESVKIICAIDTSGSISEDELSLYISEMIGIARTFHEAEFLIVTHDCKVHDFIRIIDGNVNKIRKLQLHGGGGTDHNPVYDFINEKKLRRTTKLLVSFTDGHSCFPDARPNVETIFVLAGAHRQPSQMPKWGHSVVLA